MSVRTLQRWQESGEISGDKRPTADRPEPSNKLTEEEQQAILATCNQEGMSCHGEKENRYEKD